MTSQNPSKHIYFASDVQALSLFRILFGLFLLVDFLFNIHPYFTDFFTDKGVLSRADSFITDSGLGVFSLLHMLDHPWHMALFEAAYFIGLVFFIIGYRTKIVNWIIFLGFTSMVDRNSMLNSGAEVLIEMFLLWSLFLPLNRYWSVDSALRQTPRDEPVPGILMAGIKLQITFLYLFGGFYKIIGTEWQNGIAPAFAMMDGTYGTPLGAYVAEHFLPLMPSISYATIIFQIFFSALVYSPFYNNITRTVAIIGAVLMHGSFIFLLRIGPFPFLCLAYLVLIVPDKWWDAVFAKRRARLNQLTIYFNPGCTFCEKIARLLREMCLSPHTPVLPADTSPEMLAMLHQHNSWIVADKKTGKIWMKWEAVAFVLRQNPLTWIFGWYSGLTAVKADFRELYELIGRSRQQLGRFTAVWLPFDSTPYKPSFFLKALCGVYIILAFNANIMDFPLIQKNYRYPEPIINLVKISGVYQRWNLFAPTPTHDLLSYEIKGTTYGEKEVDLLRYLEKKLMRYGPNKRLIFENHRWLKYYTRLSENKYKVAVNRVLDRICKEYKPAASGHEYQLMKISFLMEKTPIPLAASRGYSASKMQYNWGCRR